MEPDNVADATVLPISSAAHLLGISVQTLRMYEREGLIIPHKRQSGQRAYSLKDVDRLRCIRKAVNEERVGIEGVRRVLALIPCWAIVGCPQEERVACRAYTEASAPCWTFKHESNICATRDCRACDVYKSLGDCASIKSRLRDLLSVSSLTPEAGRGPSRRV